MVKEEDSMKKIVNLLILLLFICVCSGTDKEALRDKLQAASNESVQQADIQTKLEMVKLVKELRDMRL
jgi:hypothetical protein